jgi:hypothetical protein
MTVRRELGVVADHACHRVEHDGAVVGDPLPDVGRRLRNRTEQSKGIPHKVSLRRTGRVPFQMHVEARSNCFGASQRP